jgi:hypothetical protein
MTSRTATYLYCLVQSARAPSLRRAPAGLPGAQKPRLLDVGSGLWCVVADAPLERYGEEPIARGLKDLKWVSACALAHEAVVEHAALLGTVLPMKLFTLFHDDARALEHVRRQRRQIERVLGRVKGREEWGVRVLLDEVRALASARAQAARGAAKMARAAGAKKASAGVAFLARKKAEHDLAASLLDDARSAADALFEALSKRADDAHRRPPPPGEIGKRALLDAAFLVGAKKGRGFRAAAEKQRDALAGAGLVVEVTGPWPPYNFLAVGA